MLPEASYVEIEVLQAMHRGYRCSRQLRHLHQNFALLRKVVHEILYPLRLAMFLVLLNFTKCSIIIEIHTNTYEVWINTFIAF